METLEAKAVVPEVIKAGSNLPAKIETAKSGEPETAKKGASELSAASFSTYYTWRGSGTVVLNCGHPNIRSSSRVVASISEYNTDPNQNRFIGNAPMLVYNVAPYNGGVMIRLNVGFSSALNVRVDVVVDP
ncbi:hypothetical protein [Hymenobacter crusticola]|uniref:Uncharacterized protein n=1 Tax=Hymenobacter crusticola TaxID=1770526 RepID=A0A243WG53_9BACT|nr:hypothetical protein [Hymenobacter crusticola]OUJ74710.1 hypothetical protein BXP70_08075 [Hymenobacter crusticola]